MVSQELTKELQGVLKTEYGKDVSLEEAGEILTDLVCYFDLLTKIQHRRVIEEEV